MKNITIFLPLFAQQPKPPSKGVSPAPPALSALVFPTTPMSASTTFHLIRQASAFKALVKKYLPDYHKD